MYTALGWPGCKNCNLSVSAGSDIKESRGKWKQRRERGRGGEREQRSGKVEKEEEEEAKGNLACGFGNFITVYCDLLWFLPARYPVPTIVITTSSTDDVLVEGNKGEDWRNRILKIFFFLIKLLKIWQRSGSLWIVFVHHDYIMSIIHCTFKCKLTRWL